MDTSELSPKNHTEGRVEFFDIWRGFAIVSMVLFHFVYDLVYLSGMHLLWFTSPFIDIWRASISWSFLFIAGSMCAFSKNALKRACLYGTLAALIFLTTSLAHIDVPISFGIIFCMAGSTLLEAILQKFHITLQGYIPAAIFFCIFLFTLRLPFGTIGIGPFNIQIPQILYTSDFFAWLGFPSKYFLSSDYYPLLPYAMLYLCGASFNRSALRHGYPRALMKLSCPIISEIGKHPLSIYLLHQPLLLLLVSLLTGRALF